MPGTAGGLRSSHFAISACSVALSATQHAEAALEMPIVTTAKRILTSVRANACRRIGFADTFWGGCDAIVWSDPGQRRRRAKYSRRQHYCIQPQWTESDHMDPNPDYDASDELEYGINWFAWILRGAYPPPAYPPV